MCAGRAGTTRWLSAQQCATTLARAHDTSVERARPELGWAVSRHIVGVATSLGRIGVSTHSFVSRHGWLSWRRDPLLVSRQGGYKMFKLVSRHTFWCRDIGQAVWCHDTPFGVAT